MLEFYQDVLGLDPIYLEQDDQYGQVDAGAIRLSLHADGELPDPAGKNLQLQFEALDLPGKIEHLERLGVEFFDKQLDTGEAYRMAAFRDPEGNAIAIYELTNS